MRTRTEDALRRALWWIALHTGNGASSAMLGEASEPRAGEDGAQELRDELEDLLVGLGRSGQVQFQLEQDVGGGGWRLARPDHDLGYPRTFFDTEDDALAAHGAYMAKYPTIAFRVRRLDTLTVSEVLLP